ncbi:hypothetical protein P4O66_012426 [Electrophorus voltai]|uniref:Uncharacterized protein n=1 Tax=Electrophorus voltai TaxID=2609070 RepID=A0AAD8Z3L4_9TELE|nr:hypothetical protein P4O66_012426 [Electrophorus voltai]
MDLWQSAKSRSNQCLSVPALLRLPLLLFQKAERRAVSGSYCSWAERFNGIQRNTVLAGPGEEAPLADIDGESYSLPTDSALPSRCRSRRYRSRRLLLMTNRLWAVDSSHPHDNGELNGQGPLLRPIAHTFPSLFLTDVAETCVEVAVCQ